MYYTVAYVPGGQPIGALERSFAKLGTGFRRMMAKFLPSLAGS
jgi:lipopolysaccharide export system permease protein